ncbi:uncharacterized protein [Elaeis guineensis]|uniref:uncharacterized protein n=1 Tax=Elaeis guineensis var. tenera TaxID=51953 RepID=UPI003C6D55CF
MEMALLQSSVDSGLLHTPSQELPPKESLIGIKRKAVSENLPDQAPQGNHDQKQLPEQLQDWWAQLQLRQPPLQEVRNHHPSLQRLQNQKPSPQCLNGRQLPTQKLEYQPPFPEHIQNRHPLLRHSQGQQLFLQKSDSMQLSPNQVGSFWCSICKVNCHNAFNLKCHFQGKKHRAKWDEIFGFKTSVPNRNEVKGRKNMRHDGNNNSSPSNQVASFWCNLCKVNCGNSFNLECHFQGKKHKGKWNKVFGIKNMKPDGNEVNGSTTNTSPKPSLIGIKQEAVSENLPEGMFHGSQDQRLLPKQLQGSWIPLQLLQLRQPSRQQLQTW